MRCLALLNPALLFFAFISWPSQAANDAETCSISVTKFFELAERTRSQMLQTTVMNSENVGTVLRQVQFEAAMLKLEHKSSLYFATEVKTVKGPKFTFELMGVGPKGSETLRDDLERMLKAYSRELEVLSVSEGPEQKAINAAAEYAKALSKSLKDQEGSEFLAWCKKNEAILVNSKTDLKYVVELYAHDFSLKNGRVLREGEKEFRSGWARSWSHASIGLQNFVRESKKDLPLVYRRQLLKSPIKFLLPALIAYYVAKKSSASPQALPNNEREDLEHLSLSLKKMASEAQSAAASKSGNNLLSFTKYIDGVAQGSTPRSPSKKAVSLPVKFFILGVLNSDKGYLSQTIEQQANEALSPEKQKEYAIQLAKQMLFDRLLSKFFRPESYEPFIISPAHVQLAGGEVQFLKAFQQVCLEYAAEIDETLQSSREASREPNSVESKLKKPKK